MCAPTHRLWNPQDIGRVGALCLTPIAVLGVQACISSLKCTRATHLDRSEVLLPHLKMLVAGQADVVCRGLELLSGGRDPGVVCLHATVCVHSEGPQADAGVRTILTHVHTLRLQTMRPGSCGPCGPRLRACRSAICWVNQCSRQNLRAFGRRFCQLAELSAERLPLCNLSRESRRSASFYKLQFCRGLRSMSEKRVKA